MRCRHMPTNEESTEEIAFYDEFFCDESDPGIPVEVTSGNTKATIYLKRKIDLDAAQKVFNKSAQFKLVNGKKVFNGIDDQESVIQSIVVSVASWPFKYRDNKPVP